MAARKRTSGPSGPTQPEDARKRGKLTLRLSSAERADLDEVAERWGVSLADAVARLAREELAR